MGLGQAHLAGGADLAEVVRGLAIGQREYAAGGSVLTGLAGAPGGVQTQAIQGLQVQAEADRPLGKTRLVVEHERLAPFFIRGGFGVTRVLVVIEVAQVELGFAVIDKTRRSRLLRDAEGNGERQASGVIHEGSEKSLRQPCHSPTLFCVSRVVLLSTGARTV